MTDRETWSEFICSPMRAGRHLASIGRNAVGAMADAVDQASLQDFLSRIDDERAIELLAQFVDLSVGGYAAFVAEKLHGLLDALSNEKRAGFETVGPGLRGQVQWDRTLVARRAGALPAGRYYSRVAHRTFDMPINRVLVWLIHDLSAGLRAIKTQVGSQRLTPAMERMDAQLQEALGHHWLADIEPSGNVQADLALSRIDVGRGAYRDVLTLTRRRLRLQERDDERRWQEIVSLLAVGWLEPLNDDDLYELYALVLVLDILEEDLGLGAPVKIDLVRPGRREIAVFEAGDRTVSVFFDQSFSGIVGRPARYETTTASTPGLSSYPRRPDIIIAGLNQSGQIDRTVLLEVKNTSDPTYVAESIYRGFGYLHDFQDAGTFAADQVNCVLLVNGVVGTQPAAYRDLTVITSAMRGELAAALGGALTSGTSPFD
ncbi:hypothetical protein [Sphingomonas melonis]|jgi:hypothetical protein